MSARVAIVGSGAMGSVWAAYLAASGNDVVVVDVAEAVVDAINRRGIQVQRGEDAILAQPRATAQPGSEAVVDYLFVFVKAHHTDGACISAAQLVDGGTTVVSLQNGLGNSDVIARHFKASQMVIGVTYNSATVQEPGRVRHTGVGPTFVGPYDDAYGLAHAARAGDLMTDAGFAVEVSSTVKTEVWKKLILNSATLSTAALTGLRAAELLQVQPMSDLVERLVLESTAVANALGFEIDPLERVAETRAVLTRAGEGKPSMLQDVEAKRKTEIEVVNGAVVRAAASVGLDAPLNSTMSRLVGGLEKAWER